MQHVGSSMERRGQKRGTDIDLPIKLPYLINKAVPVIQGILAVDFFT